MFRKLGKVLLPCMFVSLVATLGEAQTFELTDLLNIEMSGCKRPIQGPQGPSGPPGPPGLGTLDHLYAFENLGTIPTIITYLDGEPINFNTTGPFSGIGITHPTSTTFVISETGYYFLNAVLYLDINSNPGGVEVLLNGAPIPSGTIRIERGAEGFFLVLQGIFAVPTIPVILTVNAIGSITLGNISPDTPTPATISIIKFMDV